MHEDKYESKTAALHSAPCYTERQKLVLKWLIYMKNYKKISNMSFYIYVRSSQKCHEYFVGNHKTSIFCLLSMVIN